MSKFVLTAQLQLQAPNNVGQVVRQMQSQLNNVNVNVQAKQLPKTTANVNNLTKSLGQANSAAYKLGKTFTSSLKRFAAFSVATRAVSLFTQGIGGAIAEAANFERELIKVAQVTGKSMSALKGLSDEITKLSTNLGVSSNELLNVSRALSQAGFSARETKTALEALAKSDLAPTFENMTKTAEGAIAIFNQFGQGARALEGQLGAINAIAGKFAVEAGDLISVVRRTGGVFKAAGGDLNELLALFTSVRATTRESAESIATGLRTIFTRIQRPSTLKYLDTLGVKLTDVEGKFVGPYEAIRRLSEALSGLEAGDLQFVKIAEQLGGFRQIGKVIPLLMQFGVAQEAYNTALDGTTSLSKDAQTAQGSLLVQVQKLKEEWLALVRGFTASPGFKILAQTAISLATALIKVADSLKNILPIMMAIGSVKLFSGLGGFMAGAKGAMGAAVPKFATGGMVPGSGNRDTVPAMLTPGEFVIRKSSVKKLGAQNLKSMNAKGYATGGPVVNLKDNVLGGFFLRPKGGTDRDGEVSADNVTGTIKSAGAIKKLRQQAGVPLPQLKQTKESALRNMGPQAGHKLFGNMFISGVKGAGKDSPIIDRNTGKVSQKLAERYGEAKGISTEEATNFISKKIKGKGDLNPADIKEEIKVGVQGKMKGLILGHGDSKVTGEIETMVKQEASDGLRGAIKNSIGGLKKKKLTDASNKIHINAAATKKALEKNLLKTDSSAVSTVAGYVQEGIINNVTGAAVAGGGTRLDFPRISKQARKRLDALYGTTGGVLAADAKPLADAENYKKIGNKYIGEMDNRPGRFINNHFIKKVDSPAKGFASGGPAPSDTVPAMLTPGEFVVNKKAAQSIGAANLNRMNKRGVQGFAAGGPVGGVQRLNMGGGVMGGGVAILAILPMLQAAFEKLGQSSDEVNDVFNSLKDGLAAGIGVYIGLTTILAMRKKRSQEAANAEAATTKTTMTFGQQIQAAGQWLTSAFTGQPQAGGGGGQQQNVGASSC
jgi:TP901 family phage tail tape measure protein